MDTKQIIKKKKIKGIMTTTNSSRIKVQKRDGRLEPLDINKIHFVVEEACEDLPGVSASQIEMNANIQSYDGMTITVNQLRVPMDFCKQCCIEKGWIEEVSSG